MKPETHGLNRATRQRQLSAVVLQNVLYSQTEFVQGWAPLPAAFPLGVPLMQRGCCNLCPKVARVAEGPGLAWQRVRLGRGLCVPWMFVAPGCGQSWADRWPSRCWLQLAGILPPPAVFPEPLGVQSNLLSGVSESGHFSPSTGTPAQDPTAPGHPVSLTPRALSLLFRHRSHWVTPWLSSHLE